MKLKFLMPLIAVACIVSTQGQTLADPPSGNLVYTAVPPKDRESLRQATEKFVTLRESEKWEEVYAMLNNEQHQTKDEFVKQMQHAARLIDFTPLNVAYYRPADAWVITACAAFEPPPHKRGMVFAKLNAYRVRGAWLFSDVGVAVADEAGSIRRCTAKAKPGDPD